MDRDYSASTPLTPRVIFIIGQTASGKSRLAVQLAKCLGSSVICADAFQVYRGFSVATDKVDEGDTHGVPHYGLDLLEAAGEFTVKDFIEYSVPLIEDELRKGRSPIVVGGTHMYMEKLLFTSRIDNDDSPTLGTEERQSHAWDSHEDLAKIDPVMARRLHPNDKRRISRALEFYHCTGSLMSDKLRNQERSLRFPGALVLCKVAADQQELECKVRHRIEAKMLAENKLRAELYRIRDLLDSGTLAWNKGLLQAIGYREFEAFITALRTAGCEDETLFTQAVEDLVRNTVRYAKKQATWIRKIEKYMMIHYFENFDFPEIRSLLLSNESQLKSLPTW